ncbi:uncharacterized protein aq_987-like [Haliotis cracherodii]|uniref:uncharacterized protein aq_987-like n=1 Tax=Haliotis cracherodii TaxID=6455 RepID=UPI0039EB5359
MMAAPRPTSCSRPTQQVYVTPYSLKVVTYVGDIMAISADAVVTSEKQDLDRESQVTTTLKKSSKEFAEKRDEKKRTTRRFKSWSVHTTHLLNPWPFRFVFHAIAKRPGETNRWVMKMRRLYKTIMKKAEKYGVQVLAVPLLGTGRGGAKPQEAAQAAVEAIAHYNPKCLQKVFLVTVETSIAEITGSQCEFVFSPFFTNK